jgi:hypothetical protein
MVIYPSMSKNSQSLAPLIDLANLGDSPEAVRRFRAKHPKFVPKAEQILPMRNLLRELWHGGERADRIARELLFADYHLPGDERGPLGVWKPVGVDWRRGTITYNPEYEYQGPLYDLLKCSRLAKVCARPGCAAPYFVAGRITQQYCSTDCADSVQDEYRLNWWRANGNKWRKKRRLKRRKRA